MADTGCLSEQLFLSSLSSLQPTSLLDPRLWVDRGRLSLVTEGKEQHFSIPSSGLVLAGFGKAVLGLAAHLATRLSDQARQDGCITNTIATQVRCGLLSIPVGQGASGAREKKEVEVCEAAGVQVHVQSMHTHSKCRCWREQQTTCLTLGAS